jgi:hypothetical protein
VTNYKKKVSKRRLFFLFALLVVASFAVGGLAGFLALRPRVTKSELESAAAISKLERTEAANRNAELELASTRVVAERAKELEGSVRQSAEKITILEREKTALITSISERESTLSRERESS